MTRQLMQRLGRKLSDEMRRRRLRAAVHLLGASDFEYWGRYSDTAHIAEAPLGDTWIERGRVQFEFLKDQGLRPEHRLLDYGCALLATARHVVPYIDRGNYVGIDVARNAAQRGARRLTELGIDRHNYHLLTATTPALHELSGFAFDVIFSYSVLQYLSADDFRTVTRRMHELLKPGGWMVLTYSRPTDADELIRKGMRSYDLEAYRAAFPTPDYRHDVCRMPFPEERAGHVIVIRKSATSQACIAGASGAAT